MIFLKLVNKLKIPIKWNRNFLLIFEPLEYKICSNVSIHYFHTTSFLRGKFFLDKENQFAHNILENSENYQVYNNIDHESSSTTLTDLDIDEILVNCNKINNPDDLFVKFSNVVSYCKKNQFCITNEKFDEFVHVFANNCHQFNDQQVLMSIRLLSQLPATPLKDSINYATLWNTLDKVCTDRIEKWPIDVLLLFCDCWYAVNLARSSQFVWEAMRKVGRKIRKLSPQQLVQSMFICNLIRKPVFEMFDFEVNFAKCIDLLTIHEIGVMSMGFFKTQTQIRNPELISAIYRRLIKELDNVEDITLVNILKVLRYSSKIPHTELMYELLHNIRPYIDRISLLSCLHVALLGVEIQLCEENTIELIIERFNRDIDEARIKDMERIGHVISLFNIQTKSGVENELCKKILVLIKDRVDEIIRHPKCFPLLVHYMILCGHHDNELISEALNPKFIKHAYGDKLQLGREIFFIDAFARINLKDKYSGNLLTEKQRQRMGKILTNYIPQQNGEFRLNMTDRILLEIKCICDELYGNQRCYFKHVLPHFERPDILMCYDKNKRQFIKLDENDIPDYKGIILDRNVLLKNYENRENIVTIVLIIAGWNNFVRDKDRITGLFKFKLSQLKVMGHNAVYIPWYKWRELETSNDRREFVKRSVDSLLQ